MADETTKPVTAKTSKAKATAEAPKTQKLNSGSVYTPSNG